MGTFADWMKISGLAVFFGGLSALILALGRWLNDLRLLPYLSPTEVLCCSAIGLSFGILADFHRAAFHRPMVFVELPLLLLATVIFLVTARSRRNRAAS